MMKKAGFQTCHEHNHCGQCWWEFRRELETSQQKTDGVEEPASRMENKYANDDVRLSPKWEESRHRIDSFCIKPKP